MYKLFLTFRYLTRKAIVIFPILVVWLCVMMLIIVTSIMGGFVERVQQANRQLLGDIVIEAGLTGWPYYPEFQKELAKMPEVIASTPMIHTAGLITLHLPDRNYTVFAQVIGIDPVGRAKVSGFQKTLFREYNAPLAAADSFAASGLPATTDQLQTRADSAALDAQNEYEDAYRKYYAAKSTKSATAADKAFDGVEIATVNTERALRTKLFARRLPLGRTWDSRAAIEQALIPAEPTFTPDPLALTEFDPADPKSPKTGCIVGVDIGNLNRLAVRTRRGDYYRPLSNDNILADITVVPVTARGMLTSSPSKTESFIVVDDAYSRVYDVDSTYVYAPFDVVQTMANMGGGANLDGKPIPPRCNELQIKVAGADDPLQLRAIRDAIEQRLFAFADASGHEELHGLLVRTWDQKQAQYIDAVRNEKRMLTFILGLMSLVVLVVIFLIFYMIVRDKTKDIGIIKALGGSEEGVAGIFMMYGLFIGAVGGVLGVVGGVAFVWHTNQIHEWIYQVTGIMIWNRSVYLFDEIPHTVNWWEVLFYFAAAIVAGWLGATLPAVFAGAQNPVQAVRYE